MLQKNELRDVLEFAHSLGDERRFGHYDHDANGAAGPVADALQEDFLDSSQSVLPEILIFWSGDPEANSLLPAEPGPQNSQD